MSRWEYCEVTYNSATLVSAAVVTYFRAEGETEQSIKAAMRDNGHIDVATAMSAMIAWLGQQGWELIQVERHGPSRIWYFKRPLD